MRVSARWRGSLKISMLDSLGLYQNVAYLGPQLPTPKKYKAFALTDAPLNAYACEVPLIYDICLAQCWGRANRPTPLPQTSKLQKGHEPMNDPAQTPIRCGAKTRSAALCSKFPIKGKRRCRLHGGLSTGPKTPAGRAAISVANTKNGRYKNWPEKQSKEQYYRAEIKRVMQEAREAGLLD